MDLFHVTESQQFSREFLDSLFATADDMRVHPDRYRKELQHKVVATLFYEPSTRTRLSFESAVLRLGGSVLSTENAREFSSAVKGECIEDTARIVGAYADCLIIRHNETGMVARAAAISPVPVINAGDGSGQHPTQALLDLYTLHREFSSYNNLSIALVGDLRNGRTVRSLSYLLAKVANPSLLFISPEHLKIGDDIKEYLTRKHISFQEDTNFESHLPNVDVVYMTRIQRERMSEQEYLGAKGNYVLDEQRLAKLSLAARVLHPLPHVEEIALPTIVEQTDPRIAYFRQAQNGLYTRMALLSHVLNT